MLVLREWGVSVDFPLTNWVIGDYYTYTREDGAKCSGPSGSVIAPPHWVQMVLADNEKRHREILAALEQITDRFEAA